MISFEFPIITPILLSVQTSYQHICSIQQVYMYSVQMYFPTTTTTTPTPLLCLQNGCLSTGLTCLHGSGPLAALWLPLIDLFQETLAVGRPKIKERWVVGGGWGVAK